MIKKILVIGLLILLLGISINPSTAKDTHNKSLIPVSTTDFKPSFVKQINISFESGKYTLYGEIYYPNNETEIYPGIIFCEGGGGYITPYRWIPKAFADGGYVVLAFDFPGQGKSEGIFPIPKFSIRFLLGIYLRFSAPIEILFHYFNSELINATSDALTYLLSESPVKNMINKTSIGLIGHSIGGATVTETTARDKRFKAVVALSQGNPSIIDEIDVPIQFQGGCFDILTMSILILLSCYKNANAPKEIITISGGTHIGFSSSLGPPWQKDICLHYSIGYFDYFLKNKPDAYEIITTGIPHLSKIIKSRYNFGDGERFLT